MILLINDIETTSTSKYSNILLNILKSTRFCSIIAQILINEQNKIDVALALQYSVKLLNNKIKI